jgi:transcription initiation factor IIE alpha subunit
MRLADIQKKLEVVEKKRDLLLEAESDAFGRKYITCTSNVAYRGNGCGKRFQIRNLTYIQTHFYISPWGCTGGDFWKEGEGQFDCPKCGYKNRLYDRKEFQELKQYFKDIVDEH